MADEDEHAHATSSSSALAESLGIEGPVDIGRAFHLLAAAKHNLASALHARVRTRYPPDGSGYRDAVEAYQGSVRARKEALRIEEHQREDAAVAGSDEEEEILSEFGAVLERTRGLLVEEEEEESENHRRRRRRRRREEEDDGDDGIEGEPPILNLDMYPRIAANGTATIPRGEPPADALIFLPSLAAPRKIEIGSNHGLQQEMTSAGDGDAREEEERGLVDQTEEGRRDEDADAGTEVRDPDDDGCALESASTLYGFAVCFLEMACGDRRPPRSQREVAFMGKSRALLGMATDILPSTSPPPPLPDEQSLHYTTASSSRRRYESPDAAAFGIVNSFDVAADIGHARATVEYLSGDLERAAAELDTTLDLRSWAIEAHRQRSRSSSAVTSTTAATRQREELAPWADDEDERLIEEKEEERRVINGDDDDANSLILRSKKADSLSLLGRVRHLSGDIEAALRCLERVIEMRSSLLLVDRWSGGDDGGELEVQTAAAEYSAGIVALGRLEQRQQQRTATNANAPPPPVDEGAAIREARDRIAALVSHPALRLPTTASSSSSSSRAPPPRGGNGRRRPRPPPARLRVREERTIATTTTRRRRALPAHHAEAVQALAEALQAGLRHVAGRRRRSDREADDEERARESFHRATRRFQ